MDGAPAAEDAEEKLGEVVGGPQLRDGAARRLSGDDRRRGGPGDRSVALRCRPPRDGARGGAREDRRGGRGRTGGATPQAQAGGGRIGEGTRPRATAGSGRGRTGVRRPGTGPLGPARSPGRSPAGRRSTRPARPRPAGRHTTGRTRRGVSGRGVVGGGAQRGETGRGDGASVGGTTEAAGCAGRRVSGAVGQGWGERAGGCGAELSPGHDLAHGGPRSTTRVIPGGNFAVGDLVRGGGAARQGRGGSGRGGREVHLSE